MRLCPRCLARLTPKRKIVCAEALCPYAEDDPDEESIYLFVPDGKWHKLDAYRNGRLDE